MKKILISLITFLSLLAVSQAELKNHHKEITSKDREKIALTALEYSPKTVQIYAKGLVCESCAIGIRKKLQKLNFVDTKKSEKGIVLDVKAQLVSISLKEGESVNVSELIKAIKGAGYDPIMLYQLENEKKLKSTSLEG